MKYYQTTLYGFIHGKNHCRFAKNMMKQLIVYSVKLIINPLKDKYMKLIKHNRHKSISNAIKEELDYHQRAFVFFLEG